MQKLVPDNIVFDWLSQTIIVSDWIFIDRWSMVHFLAGFFLGYLLLSRFRVKCPWLIMFNVLVAYEIFEYLFGPLFFSGEAPADIIWDLIIGTLGFALFRLIQKIKS